MAVLLVNASSTSGPGDIGECMHPLTLLFLSSYLLTHGQEATVLDLSVCSEPVAELEKYLQTNSYSVLGFTAATENRFLVWDLIVKAREILPESLIVVGGNHFTFTAEESLKAIPEIDVVVRLDGEDTLLELVEVYGKNKSLAGVAGISWRDQGQIIHNPLRELDQDIDKYVIQEVAYQHIVQPNQAGTYTRFMTMRNYLQENLKALSIHVGRGCPGRCVYCIYNRKKYRGRTAKSVIAEVKQGIEKHGCRIFHFDDPYLAKRKKFIVELCGEIKREKLDIRWYAELRADMDHSLLELMCDAGCISIDFGLETASPRVIKSIKKNVDIEKSSAFITRCHDLGIRVMAFSMISLPDEQESDALQTLNFLKKHWQMLDASYLAVTKIYPGTDLERMARERKLLQDDFSWYDRNYKFSQLDDETSRVPLWLEHLSPEFISYFKEERLKLMYSKRPFWREVSGKLLPFLSDWSERGIKQKIIWLGTAKKYLLDWPLLKLKKYNR